MLLRPTLKQIEAVNYGIKHPYTIFGMGPRTGKSVVSLGLHEKFGGNTLVIAPAYLIPNWRIEIRKWLGDDVIISSFQKGKDIYDLWDTDIALVSYDLAQKAPQLFEWADQIFIDEAHNLKSMKAKRTQFIHREIYENSIKRVYLLTGTAIKNRVEELYSLLALVHYDPNGGAVEAADDFKEFLQKNWTKAKGLKFLDRFEDSVTFADYFSYRQEYTMQISGRWVTIVKWNGHKNVDELKLYMRGKYFAVKTEDVIDLDIEPIDFYISDSPDMELLEAFEKFFDEDGNDGVGPALKAEAALKKAPFTVQYVKDLLESVKSVAVYSDHVASCKAIAEALGVPAVTGQMSPKARAAVVQRFQAGEIPVLAATIGSLSEGVTLTRTDDLVLNDPPWVPGSLKQVQMRLFAIGHERSTRLHRILGSPQDVYIWDQIAEKEETIREVL